MLQLLINVKTFLSYIDYKIYHIHIVDIDCRDILCYLSLLFHLEGVLPADKISCWFLQSGILLFVVRN